MITIKSLIVDDTNWIEVTWVDSEDETKSFCQSFHPSQIELLKDRAKEFSTSLEDYETEIEKSLARYVPDAPPVPSVEDYKQAVQSLLDSTAINYGYDDVKSAVTYAEEPTVLKFQIEGKSFRSWRSQCWEYCYEQLEKVQNKERTVPSVEELVAELPKFVLLQE